MSKAFTRFLRLKHSLQIDPVELDFTAIKLLEVCEMNSSSGQRMTVSDAMKLNKIASPATIHRKLYQLIESGYLSLEFEGKNRRTKYLTLTKKSEEYFTKLSALIKQSTR